MTDLYEQLIGSVEQIKTGLREDALQALTASLREKMAVMWEPETLCGPPRLDALARAMARRLGLEVVVSDWSPDGHLFLIDRAPEPGTAPRWLLEPWVTALPVITRPEPYVELTIT